MSAANAEAVRKAVLEAHRERLREALATANGTAGDQSNAMARLNSGKAGGSINNRNLGSGARQRVRMPGAE